MIRRRPVQRLTSAIVGASIAALGGVAIATLSGRDIDLQLVFIIGLAAMGAWLLLTAVLASTKREPVEPAYTAASGAATPSGFRAVDRDSYGAED